jgi:dTDP-4-amino-4,6-dideoxygalactose transaminase
MPRTYLSGSGRAALCRYLRHAARAGRDEVVVPAYTCWSVPASVVRAGLKVRLVDVDPSSLDLDRDELAAAVGPRTAAVVAAHLLTRTVDVGGLVRRVRERDPEVRIVEDAAQAGPAPAEDGVDAVVLSFGRGKPLPLGGGGALLCRELLDGETSGSRSGGWLRAASLAATSVLARPAVYRIPEALPFLGIGATVYDPAFDVGSPFRRWQGGLGARLLDALPRLERERTGNAQRLAARLEGCGAAAVGLPGVGCRGAMLRFPLLAPSRATREALVSSLRRRGVAASTLYPGTLEDIDALRPHRRGPGRALAGARSLAERLLTLPVYPGLRERDLDAIGRALVAACREAAA